MENTTFIDSQLAFNEAIESGLLSDNNSYDNYAGNYMYMGTRAKNGQHMFKNINTREYI